MKGELTMKRTKISLLATLLIFTIINLNGAWWANEFPCPYPFDSQCESLVAQGASSFLQSFSNFYLLLNESELGSENETTGFNFVKANSSIENTLNNLVTSRDNLSQLLSLLKKSTVESTAIQKLKSFNYEALVTTRNLHPRVMDRLKCFLYRGDLNGFLEEILSDLDSIITHSIKIQESIQNNKIPSLDNLRELFQEFSDCMLFGYYASLVFSEIKE
jgi:hypothetical protein